MPEPAVLSAYRRILRASARAFRGDAHALAAARSEIRSHYLAAADASPSDIPSKVADSDEAASFLGAHVVQGVLNERGNYKADDKILHFMLQANRPYAVQGVADMLATQGVRKPAAQRSLDALAAAGKLTCKEFGKAKIYWRPQPQGGAGAGADADSHSSASVAAATARAATLNEELVAVSAANARLAREVATAAAAPSPSTVAERTAKAEGALLALQERLAAANAPVPGAAAVPRLDRATVEKDLAAAVAAWGRNKRIFNAVFEAVTENMDSNIKNLMSELGVETDKDAGVDLVAMKALVGGGGGGGVKRGRA